MKSAAVELLVELIKNECVNDGTPDSGHEHRSVRTLQDFFDAPGVVFEPHPGRQSVVYRVRGSVPGAAWRAELADAIQGCSLLLYFITPRSIASTIAFGKSTLRSMSIVGRCWQFIWPRRPCRVRLG